MKKSQLYLKKIKKTNLYRYYIKGNYHCDTCPFCYGGEYMMGCDDYDDAGCYIKGELRDSCRLLPPFRFMLGYFRRKKSQYYQNHEYDDYIEFCEDVDKKKEAIQKAIYSSLKEEYVIPVEKELEWLNPQNHKEYYDMYHNYIGRLFYKLDDIFIPLKYESLKMRWKKLIKDTCKTFIGIFKPYFCR